MIARKTVDKEIVQKKPVPRLPYVCRSLWPCVMLVACMSCASLLRPPIYKGEAYVTEMLVKDNGYYTVGACRQQHVMVDFNGNRFAIDSEDYQFQMHNVQPRGQKFCGNFDGEQFCFSFPEDPAYLLVLERGSSIIVFSNFYMHEWW